MRMRNISIRTLWLSLIIAGSAPCIAQGDSPSHLAAAADAIVVVEVSFVPYGNLVLLREALRGDVNAIKNPEEFLGPCLPSKNAVRELAARADDQATVYQSALERAGYAAVLFLKKEGTSMQPMCDANHAHARHWEQHADHSAWRRRLEEEVRAR